jgi:hypothetical protein
MFSLLITSQIPLWLIGGRDEIKTGVARSAISSLLQWELHLARKQVGVEPGSTLDINYQAITMVIVDSLTPAPALAFAFLACHSRRESAVPGDAADLSDFYGLMTLPETLIR